MPKKQAQQLKQPLPEIIFVTREDEATQDPYLVAHEEIDEGIEHGQRVGIYTLTKVHTKQTLHSLVEPK